MSKFLDQAGLTTVWGKIKSNFVQNTKVASSDDLGLVKDGEGVTITTAGVLNLDKAAANALGGVKIGKNINIAADGTISVADSAAPANDATITIQKNGSNVDSFTVNQAENKTINFTLSKSDVGLDNVVDGAQVNVIETVKVNGTALTPSSKAVDITIPTDSDIVSKIEDYGYQTSAQVESAITGKGYQTAAQVSSAISSAIGDLGTVYNYKGSKANLAAIQAVTDKKAGDVYNAEDTEMNYAWNGTSWDPLGSTIDTPLTEQDINAATPLT